MGTASLHRPVMLVFVSDAASKLILGLVWLLLIRHLAPAELALLTLATSIAAIASQTLGSSFNRIYILRHDESGATTAGASRLLALQLALLGAAGAAGLPWSERLQGTYLLAFLVAAGTMLSDFGKTVVQKQMQFTAFSVLEVARTVAIAAALVILVLEHGSATTAAWVLSVQAAALWLVFAIAAIRHLVARGPQGAAPGAPADAPLVEARHAWLFGYFLLLAVFSQVDILLLAALAAPDELAAYGSAARYYQLLSLALGAVHAVFLPAMQRVSDPRELDALFGRHARMLAVFAPLVAACAVLSAWVLPWVDAGRYPQSVTVFQILCASAVVSFAFSPHVNLIFRMQRFRFLFALVVIALAASAALNAALVPLWGARGTAVATLVASACVTVPIYVLSLRLRRPGAFAGLPDTGATRRSTAP